MTNTEITNNNIAIEAEIEVVENNTPEQQNTEETNDKQTCCTIFEDKCYHCCDDSNWDCYDRCIDCYNRLVSPFIVVGEIIFKNDCCGMFYNNSCTEWCEGFISCLNLFISGLIILGFSIYMLVISIIISLNINSIEQKLKPPEEEENKNIINIYSKITTTSTRDVEFLGLTQGYYDITYEEAKNLKIVCIVFSVIICLFAISLPLCFACVSKCVSSLNLLTVPVIIIGYIIGYIVFNIQYHIVFALNIIISYYSIIVLHIFTGITLLYLLYLIGYFINLTEDED